MTLTSFIFYQTFYHLFYFQDSFIVLHQELTKIRINIKDLISVIVIVIINITSIFILIKSSSRKGSDIPYSYLPLM